MANAAAVSHGTDYLPQFVIDVHKEYQKYQMPKMDHVLADGSALYVRQ